VVIVVLAYRHATRRQRESFARRAYALTAPGRILVEEIARWQSKLLTRTASADHVAAADLNGDGTPDVAVSRSALINICLP